MYEFNGCFFHGCHKHYLDKAKYSKHDGTISQQAVDKVLARQQVSLVDLINYFNKEDQQILGHTKLHIESTIRRFKSDLIVRIVLRYYNIS